MKQFSILLFRAEQPIRFWPESTIGDLSYLPWLIAMITVFAATVYAIYRIRQAKDSLWRSFLSYGLKKGLDPEEIRLLRAFYDHLEVSEREKVFFDRSLFYKKLFLYLTQLGMGPWRDRVELMEKLFIHRGSSQPIHTIANLEHGEVVALELDQKHRLCSVLRAQEGRAVVYLKHGLDPDQLKNVESSLYAYRPGLGGFEAEVRIIGASEKNLLIEPKTDFQFRSEQHLTADLEIPVTIWPVPTPTEIEEMEKHKEAGKSEEPLWNRPLLGNSIKISDRAMLVDIEDKSLPLLNSRRDLWECAVSIPESGLQLDLRGKMVVQSSKRGRIIFKFTDITEEQRSIIFHAIGDMQSRREEMQDSPESP